MQRIGLIGGTGFGEALVSGNPEQVTTDYGPAMITRGALDAERELIFVARHGAGHKIPPHRINHRANISALHTLGVTAVFATTAVGSLQQALRPGDFVVLDDFLDLTKGEVVTFFDMAGQVQHTDMGDALRPRPAAHPADDRAR